MTAQAAQQRFGAAVAAFEGGVLIRGGESLGGATPAWWSPAVSNPDGILAGLVDGPGALDAALVASESLTVPRHEFIASETANADRLERMIRERRLPAGTHPLVARLELHRRRVDLYDAIANAELAAGDDPNETLQSRSGAEVLRDHVLQQLLEKFGDAIQDGWDGAWQDTYYYLDEARNPAAYAEVDPRT